MTHPLPRLRVRWIIFSYLFSFAFIANIQRTSIAITAERMMPELGVSQVQIGWLLTAFFVGYTAFQLPGGLLGERLGARVTFVVIGLVALVATLLTPWLPAVLGGTALFLGLLTSRFLVGVAQAPIYPVSSGVLESWFPIGSWAFPQGLQVAGGALAAAATPPLIAWLMQTLGWKTALVATSIPAVAVIGLWWWYGRNRPEEHRSVSKIELAEVQVAGVVRFPAHITRSDVVRVLADRNILLLSLSYMCMGYASALLQYWCFLYLVQERHFAILESGLLAGIPLFASFVGAAVGGEMSDRLCPRLGVAWGFRAVPLLALPLAGIALYAAVGAGNAYWAVALMSLAYAGMELTEGAYMAGAMRVAREHTMAATGVVNSGGNLGSVLCTPIVAALSGSGNWTAAFVTGAAFSIAGGLLWLWIDVSRHLSDPVIRNS
jgi:MFS transporter, ACS family, glucarate transporter